MGCGGSKNAKKPAAGNKPGMKNTKGGVGSGVAGSKPNAATTTYTEKDFMNLKDYDFYQKNIGMTKTVYDKINTNVKRHGEFKFENPKPGSKKIVQVFTDTFADAAKI